MEVTVLNLLVFVAFILAPIMTNSFFLENSKAYSAFHKIALVVLGLSGLLNAPSLGYVWPLFCVFGLFLYLKKEKWSFFSIKGIATLIPFTFSLISATWFVAGNNDLSLLGYNKNWSLYAALHGSFLGWLFVGCIAYLSKRQVQTQKIYLYACYVCLVLFLLVAFGIDGVPYVKRIGVIGLSFVVPSLIGLYTFKLKRNQRAFKFSLLSFISIIFTMLLAVLYEFLPSTPKLAFGISFMVISHGLINALITIPSFFWAIKNESAQSPGR